MTSRTQQQLLDLLDQPGSNISLGKSVIDRQVLIDIVDSIPSLGGGISAVLDDLTPTLGADLDTNNFRIKFNTGRGINDQNDNEQLTFTQSVNAINHITMINAATGIAPRLIVGGGDPNIDFEIESKAGGRVKLMPGNVSGVETDNSVVAGNTRLLVFDVDNNTVERVTVGAVDTGGAGFKVLRIPN